MKLRKTEKLPFVIILFAAGVMLYFGWRVFWFLTDDAYISFRYISNNILGYGYVWNPPPFRPVEGYSNFLWIVLLDIIWRIFDIAPPESSNYLSLFFSFGTLALCAVMFLRIRWNPNIRRHLILMLGLVFLGVLSNRTFLAWTSSGLETAMLNFFITLWIYCCIFIRQSSKRWLFSVSTLASLIYLTRPDGLLFAAATAAMVCVAFLRKHQRFEVKRLLTASSLLLIVIHLLWRKSFYGEWLPNTYYVKYTGIWPESGIRYVLSFILEYSLWVWLGLLCFVLIRKFPALVRTISATFRFSGSEMAENNKFPEHRSDPLIIFCVLSTLAVHIFYYTFIIGGDHFEYRVYSYLILLIFISFVWLLNMADFKGDTSIILLSIFILLSWPVPWTHWALTHRIGTRMETQEMRVGISGHWPKSVRWYAKIFDDLQFWLIEHYVCMRHQEHKVCHLWQIDRFPSRSQGLSLPSDGFPTSVQFGVGVSGWALPRINIIDIGGLNDYVTARNPCEAERVRKMAHDKRPPEGYVECFVPNVRLSGRKRIEFGKRDKPLTAEDIIESEKKWAKKIKKAKGPL
ncbi:MAG: hypothetical protein ACYS9Y_09640 [Planctomycetota bacterium]